MEIDVNAHDDNDNNQQPLDENLSPEIRFVPLLGFDLIWCDAHCCRSDLVSECVGGFGTKISALMTDIKRKLRADPKYFKAIVFSAWNQFLHIIKK